MSDRFLRYLEREHDRLEAAIDNLRSSRGSDDAAIARLKKQKLAVKDQIAQWQRDCSVAA
jgi:hypothetical protein